MNGFQKLFRSSDWIQFQGLALRNQPFNLLELLDDAVCENAWSRILAFLFDSSEKHLLGTTALMTWCRSTKRLPDIVDYLMVSGQQCSISTETEWGTFEDRRLDILIKISDGTPSPLFVVGIENKIWSGESVRQISDYQTAIRKAFPRSRCYMIFLSPDGRKSHTAGGDDSGCPCSNIGYDTLVTLCAELQLQSTHTIGLLLGSLADYIKKNLMSATPIDQSTLDAARKILRDPSNRRSLELIGQCRDLLPELRGKLEEHFRLHNQKYRGWEFYPDDARLPQEFKLHIPELDRQEFSIYFMVRSDKAKPFFGDKYRVLAGAYCSSGEVRKTMQPAFPLKSSVTEYRNWDKWLVLWVGQEYTLEDLSDHDAQALAQLLEDGIRTTLSAIRKAVEKC